MPTLALLFAEFQKNMTSTFLDTSWSDLRHAVARHVTKVKSEGRYIRGLSERVDADAAGKIESLMETIDHQAYFVNDLWRGFCWWSVTGKINPRWKMTLEDGELLATILTPFETEKSRSFFDRVTVDWTAQPKAIDDTLARIRPYIGQQCIYRLSFIKDRSYDLNDHIQQVNYYVVKMLIKNNSKIDSLETMRKRAMTYATQGVTEIARSMLARWRTRTNVAYDDESEDYASDMSSDQMDQRILMNELMKKATPKIRMYLQAMLEEEAVPEFKAWRKENPRQIHTVKSLDIDIRKWLDMPSDEIHKFIKREAPELLERHCA